MRTSQSSEYPGEHEDVILAEPDLGDAVAQPERGDEAYSQLLQESPVSPLSVCRVFEGSPSESTLDHGRAV